MSTSDLHSFEQSNQPHKLGGINDKTGIHSADGAMRLERAQEKTEKAMRENETGYWRTSRKGSRKEEQ